jgi:hypothetical protein
MGIGGILEVSRVDLYHILQALEEAKQELEFCEDHNDIFLFSSESIDLINSSIEIITSAVGIPPRHTEEEDFDEYSTDEYDPAELRFD